MLPISYKWIVKIACLFFLYITSGYAELLPSKPLTKQSGVVFIHGNNDHLTDVMETYWEQPFIDKVTRFLPKKENVLIVHCNFRHYMWQEDTAGCIASQIDEFIAKNHINDYHSFCRRLISKVGAV